MPASFVIEELPTLGGSGIRATPQRFTWNVEQFSAPQKPLAHGGEQRFNRRDNAGAEEPTIQVLGPKIKPLQVSLTWNDRFNTPGYAKDAKRLFTALAYRGNRVRIQFEDIDFVGLIVNWDFEEFEFWKIGLTFTAEIFRDALINKAREIRSVETIENPLQAADEARALFDIATSDLLDPWASEGGSGLLNPWPERAAITGSKHLDTTENMTAIGVALDKIDSINDQRVFATARETTEALKQVSNGFRVVRSRCVEMLDDLADAKASTELTYRNAESEISFELWRHSLSYGLRQLRASANKSERHMAERADSNPIGFYRASTNETGYDVSNAVYGTPHLWREIWERNNLESFRLTGDQILIIPEEPVS